MPGGIFVSQVSDNWNDETIYFYSFFFLTKIMLLLLLMGFLWGSQNFNTLKSSNDKQEMLISWRRCCQCSSSCATDLWILHAPFRPFFVHPTGVRASSSTTGECTCWRYARRSWDCHKFSVSNFSYDFSLSWGFVPSSAWLSGVTFSKLPS